MQQIKLAIRQLLDARKYSVSYRIVLEGRGSSHGDD